MTTFHHPTRIAGTFLLLASLILITPSFATPPGDKAANSRSDTVDILHYDISLNITDFATQNISGNCKIKFTPLKNNVNTLFLDLLKLTVDSVILGGTPQVFTHNDTLLKINLTTTYNINDTAEISVYYRGKPVRDLSWGGFYFQGNYAYNLGVGFDANPHNYGRVWFPCFDNFVERSSYTFRITTSGGKKAHCNGLLVSETPLAGDTIIRTWQLDEEIPSYLACVAVADYETVSMQHTGIAGPIPIELAARAVDTTLVKNSFVHLGDAIDAFENAYGPFLFSKVGYSIVPFNAGAMEHATNIAYPRYAANGTTGSETLMAHELAHHWWGDLVTCEVAEEMWLNEGMASYSEHIFLEHTYDRERYIEAVKQNHVSVLQYAHITEKEYRAITGLPHQYTYGTHVYDKGASVAHNLRTYMGDNQFFTSLKSFLVNHQFASVNSTMLRNELSSLSGKDLTDFFNDWVFNPGFPHFSIDSFKVEPAAGKYNVSVNVRQKKRGSPAFFQHVPMEVTFYNENLDRHVEAVDLAGEHTVLNFTLNEEPLFVTLNENDLINQAVSADQLTIRDTGNYDLNFARINITVTGMEDSVFLRAEHHWAAPDALKENPGGIRLSDYRYWTVDGVWNDDFHAYAEINYDGRNSGSGGDGFLDVDLLKSGEDSILLFYRRGAHDKWREFRHYSVNNMGSISDRFGKITIDSLIPGEYALAKGQSVIGKKEIEKNGDQGILIFPNPVKGLIGIEAGTAWKDTSLTLEVFDLQGKLMLTRNFTGVVKIDTGEMSAGSYLFVVRLENKRLKSEKVMIY